MFASMLKIPRSSVQEPFLQQCSSGQLYSFIKSIFFDYMIRQTLNRKAPIDYYRWGRKMGGGGASEIQIENIFLN